MIFTFFFLYLLTIQALGSPVAVPGVNEPKPNYIPGNEVKNAKIAGTLEEFKNSYIIVYKKSASDSAIAEHEVGLKSRFNGLKGPAAQSIKVKGFRGYWLETNKEGLETIAKSPLIDYVELDSVATIPEFNQSAVSTPTERIYRTRDVQQNAPWGLARISNRLFEGQHYWYDGSSCEGTVIYILDTGIRTTHAEFRDGWRAHIGAHFISNNPNDNHGHGTHCAAIAAGKTVGVCRNAIVVSVKVLGDNGIGSLSAIMQGLQWAVSDAQARGVPTRAVISMSIGLTYSQALNDLVNQIVGQGTTVVVGAGNGNVDVSGRSPASAEQAITVAASDQNNIRASFSNFGNLADIYAPGVDIFSASIVSDNHYISDSGTSMAAPHAAGVAAYLMALHNLNSPAQVRGKMYDFASWNVISDARGPNALLHNGWI